MTVLTMPSNPDAEEQVLGAIMAKGTITTAIRELRPDDFYSMEHRHLFETLVGMADRGEPTDLVSVAARVKGNGVDPLKLRGLVEGLTTIEATDHHAKLIRENAERRRLVEGAQRVITTATDGTDLTGAYGVAAEMARPRSGGPAASSPKLLTGMAFADAASQVGPAIWGEGTKILWQPGEPFMLYGPQGVGKTTLAQRLLLGRIGVNEDLLGLPVTSTDELVLYVAADRPLQAARSWARMVGRLSPEQQRLVDARVMFHMGPLPFDPGQTPDALVAFLAELRIGSFFADSLKDLAVDLEKPEVGSRVNRAWQLCIAEGIEIVDLHHPKKGDGSTQTPKDLDRVFGNTWLTAGHGSVVRLWGQPGDPIVELMQLKEPMGEQVGPLRLNIDHDRGLVTVHDGGDPLAILRAASGGMGAHDVARVLFNTSKPTDADVEKARRRVQKLVAKGLAHKREGGRGADGKVAPALFFPVPPGGLQEPMMEAGER